MEHEKRLYRDGFLRLKDLRTQIESLQHMMEKQRRKMQSDFDNWFATEQAKVKSVPGRASAAPTPMPAAPAPAPAPAQTQVPAAHAYGNGAYGYGQNTAPSPVPVSAPVYKPPTPTVSAGAYGAAPSPVPAAAPAPAAGVAQFVSTGNKQADADIAAFYKIRDEMLKRT